jgi:hypothetical protein
MTTSGSGIKFTIGNDKSKTTEVPEVMVHPAKPTFTMPGTQSRNNSASNSTDVARAIKFLMPGGANITPESTEVTTRVIVEVEPKTSAQTSSMMFIPFKATSEETTKFNPETIKVDPRALVAPRDLKETPFSEEITATGKTQNQERVGNNRPSAAVFSDHTPGKVVNHDDDIEEDDWAMSDEDKEALDRYGDLCAQALEARMGEDEGAYNVLREKCFALERELNRRGIPFYKEELPNGLADEDSEEDESVEGIETIVVETPGKMSEILGNLQKAHLGRASSNYQRYPRNGYKMVYNPDTKLWGNGGDKVIEMHLNPPDFPVRQTINHHDIEEILYPTSKVPAAVLGGIIEMTLIEHFVNSGQPLKLTIKDKQAEIDMACQWTWEMTNTKILHDWIMTLPDTNETVGLCLCPTEGEKYVRNGLNIYENGNGSPCPKLPFVNVNRMDGMTISKMDFSHITSKIDNRRNKVRKVEKECKITEEADEFEYSCDFEPDTPEYIIDAALPFRKGLGAVGVTITRRSVIGRSNIHIDDSCHAKGDHDRMMGRGVEQILHGAMLLIPSRYRNPLEEEAFLMKYPGIRNKVIVWPKEKQTFTARDVYNYLYKVGGYPPPSINGEDMRARLNNKGQTKAVNGKWTGLIGVFLPNNDMSIAFNEVEYRVCKKTDKKEVVLQNRTETEKFRKTEREFLEKLEKRIKEAKEAAKPPSRRSSLKGHEAASQKAKAATKSRDPSSRRSSNASEATWA